MVELTPKSAGTAVLFGQHSCSLSLYVVLKGQFMHFNVTRLK